jgi:Rap1a immunity proteins
MLEKLRLDTMAAAAAVMVLASSGASAQQATTRRVPRTVADLASVCAIPPSAPDYTAATYFCRGFLAGAGQYHAAIHPEGSPNPRIFCLPDPRPRLVDVAASFVAWAQANPQYGTEMAVDGLMRFAQQTYPCPPMSAPSSASGRRR